jgi:hypothetical protein
MVQNDLSSIRTEKNGATSRREIILEDEVFYVTWKQKDMLAVKYEVFYVTWKQNDMLAVKYEVFYVTWKQNDMLTV